MGVGLAVVTETKITNDCYTRLASGYKILASKAASHNQGGIALLWKENHQGFEVESAKLLMPNLLTFLLVTGDERFYCMGVYIPPTDTMGVENLRAAWEACLEGCMPLILGDLNINFGEPRGERDEVICDLTDDINLVDVSRRYTPRRPRRQSTRARWTWRQKREGKMHYSQPDYVMVRERDHRRFWNVGFRWPGYHESDHPAVVATIKSGRRRLKEYRRKRQEFPLKLPPVEQQDDLTRAFEALKVTCEEPEITKAHWSDWMSDSTWLLIKQHTSLRQAGQLCQSEGRRMQHTIHAALKRDRAARTAQVGESIIAKLAEGNVHEAFRHLKGWYQEASETQARPCFQTMERQTVERVELYRRRDSPGLPIVVNHAEMCTEIRDDTPDEEEIHVAVAELTNGRSAGVSRMRAEHLKGWLKGAKLEEDPKTGPANVGAGEDWAALVKLVQTVWDAGSSQSLSRKAAVIIAASASLSQFGKSSNG
jgi:hypothetical protein